LIEGLKDCEAGPQGCFKRAAISIGDKTLGEETFVGGTVLFIKGITKAINENGNGWRGHSSRESFLGCFSWMWPLPLDTVGGDKAPGC
jgi:hypothetical protein